VEFLVRIEIRLPPEMTTEEREGLGTRELLRGQALRQSGNLVRIWRVPGRHANVGVWRATDATELHDLLTALPLFPWMTIDVQPLATHPLERD
jgi:muconolactone D-isomerase